MLNLGNYYGGGYTSTTGTGATGRVRSASSANFNTMARNIAAGYSSDIEVIQNYLKEGKTDKAIEMYDSLFEDVKSTTDNYNYEMTDSEIKSILKTAYEGTTGTSIVNSIEKNTSNSFWTGFKQAMPIYGLFCNDMSEAEAMAELTGEKVSLKEKVLEGLGWAVGTGLTWLAFGWLKGPSAVAQTVVSGVKTAGGWLQSGFNAIKGLDKIVDAGKLVQGAAVAATVGTQAVGAARVAEVIEY